MQQETYLVTPQTSVAIAQQATESEAQREMERSVRELEMRRLRDITFPSIVRIMTYFVIAVAMLVATNWKNIINAINQNAVDSQPFLQSLPNYISAYTDNQIVSWLTIVLFWGTIGLAAYTVFWLGMAFFTAARNELIVETAFSNRGHFWEKIRVPLMKLVMLIATAVAIILTMRYGIPVWNDLFASGLYHIGSGSMVAFVQFAIAIFGAMANLHLIITTILIFRHADGIL